MKELGMGHDRYVLIDLDNGGKRITAAEAAEGLKPVSLLPGCLADGSRLQQQQ